MVPHRRWVIEVMQDIFGPPYGNCFAACVASILEIDDLERVPNYHGPTWYAQWQAWLAIRGLGIEDYVTAWETCETPEWWCEVMAEHYGWRGPMIAGGPSPRGPWWHAVVVEGGAIVHDPSPTPTRYLMPEGLGAVRIIRPLTG